MFRGPRSRNRSIDALDFSARNSFGEHVVTIRRRSRLQKSDEPRVVAIGDLNGAYEPLFEILKSTSVVDRRGRWKGGNTHVVQLGDIFNRGSHARQAFEWLLDLRQAAQ